MNKKKEAEALLELYSDIPNRLRDIQSELQSLGSYGTVEEIAYRGITPTYEKREGGASNKTSDPTFDKVAELTQKAKAERVENLIGIFDCLQRVTAKVDSAMFKINSAHARLIRMKYMDKKPLYQIAGTLKMSKRRQSRYDALKVALEAFYDEYMKGEEVKRK